MLGSKCVFGGVCQLLFHARLPHLRFDIYHLSSILQRHQDIIFSFCICDSAGCCWHRRFRFHIISHPVFHGRDRKDRSQFKLMAALLLRKDTCLVHAQDARAGKSHASWHWMEQQCRQFVCHRLAFGNHLLHTPQRLDEMANNSHSHLLYFSTEWSVLTFHQFHLHSLGIRIYTLHDSSKFETLGQWRKNQITPFDHIHVYSDWLRRHPLPVQQFRTFEDQPMELSNDRHH